MDEPNPFKRRLKFLGFLAAKLRSKNVDPILVGGAAAEFYTHGQYTTADMDILVTRVGERDITLAILRQLDFKPSGRVMYNKELGIAVDVLERLLSGDPGKVKKVELGKDWFRVIGAEDLLIERLVMAKHWGKRRQAESALALFKAAPSLDMNYLKERAATDERLTALKIHFENVYAADYLVATVDYRDAETSEFDGGRVAQGA